MHVSTPPTGGQGPPPSADAEFTAAARKFARAKVEAATAVTDLGWRDAMFRAGWALDDLARVEPAARAEADPILMILFDRKEVAE